MSGGEPVLSADGVTVRSADRTILADVSCRVWAGEKIALVGPSGSGKTTLLTVLAGLVTPAAGQVRVHGSPLGTQSGRRRELSIIVQGYGLVPLLSAAENIEVALRAAGRSPVDAMDAAAAILARLGLDRFGDHLVDELSGGQQQRVAVARGVALGGTALLADEPTAEQDAEHRAAILKELFAVADGGAGLVIATHDAEVAGLCDRIVEINDGRLGPTRRPD